MSRKSCFIKWVLENSKKGQFHKTCVEKFCYRNCFLKCRWRWMKHGVTDGPALLQHLGKVWVTKEKQKPSKHCCWVGEGKRALWCYHLGRGTRVWNKSQVWLQNQRYSSPCLSDCPITAVLCLYFSI